MNNIYVFGDMSSDFLKGQAEMNGEFHFLPGGLDTVQALLEVLAKTASGEIDPKCIRIYNIEGFYHPLMNQLLTMVDEGLLSESIYNRIEEANSLDWQPL